MPRIPPPCTTCAICTTCALSSCPLDIRHLVHTPSAGHCSSGGCKEAVRRETARIVSKASWQSNGPVFRMPSEEGTGGELAVPPERIGQTTWYKNTDPNTGTVYFANSETKTSQVAFSLVFLFCSSSFRFSLPLVLLVFSLAVILVGPFVSHVSSCPFPVGGSGGVCRGAQRTRED